MTKIEVQKIKIEFSFIWHHLIEKGQKKFTTSVALRNLKNWSLKWIINGEIEVKSKKISEQKMRKPYQNKNWQKPLTSGNCLVANVLLDGVNSNLHFKKKRNYSF